MMIGSMAGADEVTVGGDKGFDTREFVAECRQMNATPHVAQKAQHSAIDRRTTRQAGYGSQQKCKRVEEIFGWMFTFAAAAYNLVRIRNLSSAIQAGSV